MSDTDQPTGASSTPIIDMDAILRGFAEWEAEAEKLMPRNKATLFGKLAAARITHVTVTFDGGGDSGQIEDICAFRGEILVDLPEGEMELTQLHYGSAEPTVQSLATSEVIESLCYDLLRQKHAGWENNEGGWGEFTFNVVENSIELDMNVRIETSESYGYEW